MRYSRALASDYDDTLAEGGVVDPETILGIERLRQSGRKFILVTGRQLLSAPRIPANRPT